MISIRFKDNIIKEYSIDKLKEIPFFKGLIESCIKINNVLQFNEFDSEIINNFICEREKINFDKYKFDDLFHAKEFLMLYNEPQTQVQFTEQLKHLLLNDINRIDLNNLQNYIYDDDEYLLSDVINEKPELIQLYPYVTSLRYINKNLDLTKFNNLNTLIYYQNIKIKTFVVFDNLKALKELYCVGCENLEDGCFDIFTSLEKLSCGYCYKLKKPFNNNLKNLKELNCSKCENLKDECFDMFISLEKLTCGYCCKLKKPFNNNLKNLKYLDCSSCYNLKDECFDCFYQLRTLYCSFNRKLKNPFNINLKNLEELDCSYCDGVENNCFDIFNNLKILCCNGCYKFKNPFNENLKTLKILHCAYCCNLNDKCFDSFKNLEILFCENCKQLKKPFNANLKSLIRLCCCECHNLEDGCFGAINVVDSLKIGKADLDVLKNLTVLYCSGCKKIKRPFNNLKNLKELYCSDCIHCRGRLC